MDNNTLKSLLQEYEQKRINANLRAENYKIEVYSKYPRLKEIEDEINILSINKIKLILSPDSKNNKDITAKINKLKQEKKEILKSANISEKSLQPIYECEFCKDTGYINDNNKSIMCNCLKQKIFDIDYNKSNIGNIENENFNSFSLKYYSKEVNPEKFGLDISPLDNIKKIKEIVDDFINNFENPEEKNLLFTGDTGLRKNFSLQLYSI